MSINKPKIINDPAAAFINAGKEEAPVAQDTSKVVDATVEVVKKRAGRKPDPNKKIYKCVSLRVPPKVHENLLEYTFEHRDEKISLNTYIIEATIEKMKKDGLL